MLIAGLRSWPLAAAVFVVVLMWSPPTAGADDLALVEPSPAPFHLGIEDGRPTLRSAYGRTEIDLGGRLNLDYHAPEDGVRTLTGAGLDDRLFVRRLRLELSGTLFGWLDILFEPEFSEATGEAEASLKTGYGDVTFVPALSVRLGQFKVPFSLELLAPSLFTDFIERSVVEELDPNLDTGVSLHGTLLDDVLGYEVGLFTGKGEDAPRGDAGPSLAGRFTVAPFVASGPGVLRGLRAGADFTWGDQGLVEGAQGRTGARTEPRFRFFASHPVRGERSRWGVDLNWVAGPASLRFEWARQRDERRRLGPGGSDLDPIRATAWYVSTTYLLTGEDEPLDGEVAPRRPFSPLEGQVGPGAWELALRYAEAGFASDGPIDFFDGDVADGIPGGGATAGNGAEALTVGLTWYPTTHVRFMVNWTQYWYDNPLGTPWSCRHPPCTAATLTPAAHSTSWEVLSRMQVWF
jgi:phosphate-selective porin OprO/OprP